MLCAHRFPSLSQGRQCRGLRASVPLPASGEEQFLLVAQMWLLPTVRKGSERGTFSAEEQKRDLAQWPRSVLPQLGSCPQDTPDGLSLLSCVCATGGGPSRAEGCRDASDTSAALSSKLVQGGAHCCTSTKHLRCRAGSFQCSLEGVNHLDFGLQSSQHWIRSP